jgi:hypothetical protein
MARADYSDFVRTITAQILGNQTAYSVLSSTGTERRSMPRFFFNCEGAQTFRDEEGVELPDLAAARVQAIRNASEVLRDHSETFARNPNWRFHVSDAAGRLVFGVMISPDHGQRE